MREFLSVLRNNNIHLKLAGNELSVKFPKGKIDAQLLEEIKQKKADIISYLASLNRSGYSNIPPAPEAEFHPLSPAQKRLYFLYDLAPGSISYNMPMVTHIGMSCDSDRISRVMQMLVSRHEALRTSFHKIGNDVYQKVNNNVMFLLDRHECGFKEFDHYISTFIKPFDLSQPSQVRSSLVHVREVGYIWIVDLHHIISDGISQEVLRDEFIQLYNGGELPEVLVQYKDFSHWQNGMIQRGELQKQHQFWLDQFKGDIPKLDLPADRPRPVAFTFEGDTYSFTIGKQLSSRLREMGAKWHGSLQMTLLSFLNVLLHKYTRQEDIIIGCGIAGRLHPDVERTVGMFVNSLAIRTAPRSGVPFIDYYKEVIATSILAYENQGVQFEDLVDMLKIERDPSRNPLFDVVLSGLNFEESKTDASGVMPQEDSGTLSQIGHKNSISKFDMTWYVTEKPGEISINIEYYNAVYDRSMIERMAAHFLRIMEVVLDNTSILISDIKLLSADEERELMSQLKGPEKVIAQSATLHGLFEEQCEATPNNIAVHSFEPLSYIQLDRKANQLARFLIDCLGTAKGARIGVLQSRGADMIVSILAILKAGGVYVPLDSAYPEERLLYMLSDAGVEVLLTEKILVEMANRLQWRQKELRHLVCIDSENFHQEKGGLRNNLMRKDLWDHIGDTATDEISGGGWTSSYTGEYLSDLEMLEYGRNAYLKLKKYLHKEARVLEIGCASGLTMFQVAPEVDFYYGTDLSSSILAKTSKFVKQKGLANIKLACMPAHEIDTLDEDDFDIVIINSVIQSFDGHNYLQSVIRKAISKMREKGILFIGDIMDEDKREELVSSLKEFKVTNQQKNYRTKTDLSSELFVSREYWNDLIADSIGIVKVVCSEKIRSVENELTLFRYDALVEVDAGRGNVPLEKSRHQHDMRSIGKYPTSRVDAGISGKDLAYVIYTSGSTGLPKGVMIEHRSIVNTISFQQEIFDVKEGDRCLQFASATFDASVSEIFVALAGGAALYIINDTDRKDPAMLERFITEHKIDLATIPPAYLKLLDIDKLKALRKLVTAGEDAVQKDANTFLKHGIYYNAYGPTETSICATVLKVEKHGVIASASVSIGSPIANTTILIMDEGMNLLPYGAVGEIFIGGMGLSRGYLNKPELTSAMFVADPYRKGEVIYRTGDLGRIQPGGNIEFLGRKDEQVKVRGYRIELGEIESIIREYPSVKDAVVTVAADKNKNLNAYYVTQEEISISDLASFIAARLPEYMLPSNYIRIDKVPLSVSGKIDKRSLPRPGSGKQKVAALPDDPIMQKLIPIWSDVLSVPEMEIGADANFFQLGGHSLSAISLVSAIYKSLNIELQLRNIFEHQTLAELAGFISQSTRVDYASIPLAVKKDLYPLSAAQKRLYFLQQMDPASTSYNIPLTIYLEPGFETSKLDEVFQRLVERHDSFRTSFVVIDDQPYQQIRDKAKFVLEKIKASEEQLPELIGRAIRPFNLQKDMLLRACLFDVDSRYYVLVVDMHHIISDGSSSVILENDFKALLRDEELPPLKYQYKDFSEWQNHLAAEGKIAAQENYWKNLFADEIPRLDITGDFKRPEIFTFKGDTFNFTLSADETTALRDMRFSHGSTLYMNVLSLLNVLFHKYTGQSDIVIGCNSAGRPHSDFLNIVGMFVNTLAMRNRPEGEKTFTDFLKEITANSITAFENQDVQFEDLVDMLKVERDPSRNPLFDVCMVVQNYVEKKEEERFAAPDHELPALFHNVTSKFDLTFFIYEAGDMLDIQVEYYTGLFRRETIARMVEHFKIILRTVAAKPGIAIKDIDLVTGEERKLLLHDFNNTATDYLRDKALHLFFEENAAAYPDRNALVMGDIRMTYRELNEKVNQLAHYLIDNRKIKPNDLVGIYQERSFGQVISVLAILKSGAAYVPIDISLPEQRVKSIIDDSGICVLLSQKAYNRELNRLLWSCKRLEAYFCIDTDSIHDVQENTGNESMNPSLWEYIGEQASDDIGGGGWTSSYTGKPMSRAEMDEYGDNVLKKVLPLVNNKSRVLEIGCASGISMFRIAPHVGLYYGTDLSRVIIEKNKARVKAEGHDNIRLSCCFAHEIDQIGERGFDLIVLNSVIQSFHGHNYLLGVIRKCISLLSDTGHLFIGDVMDQELKEDLIASIEEFKRNNNDLGVISKTDFSSELFVSRDYFRDLQCDIPSIGEVLFTSKIRTIENELTLFRYDVLLEINKKNPTVERSRTKHQHDLSKLEKKSKSNPSIARDPEDLAYVIYTSGTTGLPKGSRVLNRNFRNLINWFIKDFSINGNDSFLMVTSMSFDLTQKNLFAPLITGGLLKLSAHGFFDPAVINDEINASGITNLNCTPGMFYQLVGDDEENGFNRLKSLRKVYLGGEPIDLSKLRAWKRSGNCNAEIINTYGPTECADICLSHVLSWDGDMVPLGTPVYNCELYVINEYDQLVPIGVRGEICISGEGVGAGYISREELTRKKFTRNPFGGGKRFYRTGDLGRWLPDGTIEFLGRKDDQVKIRGFRIELGEIESQLRRHELIKDAVVSVTQEEEKMICAYYTSDKQINSSELVAFLSGTLPEYMMPSCFVQIDKMPLTSHGKVNKKALPHPRIGLSGNYTAPSGSIELKLAEAWSEVLSIPVDEISAGANFFELGGHSLKATILVSKIHKMLNVKLPLAEIFRNPTLRALAQCISGYEEDKHSSIQPVPRSDWYPLSSAQKRLYFLDHFENVGTTYNMPSVMTIHGKLDREVYQRTLQALVERHESLRTSFTIIDNTPVQVVHDKVEVVLEEIEAILDNGQVDINAVSRAFTRPFNLSKAPLLRMGVATISQDHHLLVYDLHHIISDGTSMAILENDFLRLLSGEVLMPLQIQYKDYASWQNALLSSERILEQERYWLDKFSGGIPRLELPADHPRPSVFTFKGGYHGFNMGEDISSLFLDFCKRYNVTPFMHLLGCFTVMLHKYSGEEDIVVGNSIFGRPHADLHGIIGMFINELAVRTSPARKKSYADYIAEIKKSCLEAYENQDYQFEELIDKLNIPRDPSRNPLFDVCLSYQNFDASKADTRKAAPAEEYSYKDITSKFDLSLYATEYTGNIHLGLEYCSSLFKEERIIRIAGHLREVIKQVSTDPGLLISKVSMITPNESLKLLSTFNYIQSDYPDKCIHELFEEQALRYPEKTAVIMNDASVSYFELDRLSNQVGNYLQQNKKIGPDAVVGMLMDKSIQCIAAMLGILKSGGAYLPLSTGTPYDRLCNIINDSRITVLVSEKKYVKQLNRLLWECPLLQTYVCVDSECIDTEEEASNSLMDIKLWEFIGQRGDDAISKGGWLSSYTGLPIPKEEMEEYSDNIAKKLGPMLNSGMRVLEVGCATGLSMYRLAPEVGLYYGTDLSPVIIEENRKKVIEEGIANIKLECIAAHDIDKIQENGFDLIILNSVIQHFHGHNYLRGVIKNCISKLSERGMIFIGDIMDLDRKDALIREMTEFKSTNADKGYRTKTDWSEELFTSREYYLDLQADLPEIDSVEFSDKIYTIPNELTKFRFDALLKIDKIGAANKAAGPKVKWQDDMTQIRSCSTGKPVTAVRPSNLCYVIYTSGTTGIPKGVMVEHGNVVSLICNGYGHFDFNETDVWTMFHSYNFDFSVWEMYGSLLKGGKLILVSKETAKDASAYLELLVNEGVTVLNQTPSAFYALQKIEETKKQNDLKLRYVIFGGEALHPARLKSWYEKYPGTKLINMYGITETTVHVTYKEIGAGEIQLGTSNIGRPLPTLSAYILDEDRRLVPTGVPGELCIGGEGVSRGYLGDDELTRKKFITHPYDPHERLYCSGDLVKLTGYGELEYLGRIDSQVKIRGYRIELGEIESQLRKHEGIKDAIVTARGEVEKILCAYYVSHEQLSPADLSTFLGRSLPEYMIPPHFVQIDRIPLTVNGKVDRKALPDPKFHSVESHLAPVTVIESTLAAIWSEILSIPVDDISTNANFFDQGGHSLRATILMARIQSEFNVQVPLAEIFMYPTIKQIGSFIEAIVVNKGIEVHEGDGREEIEI